MVSYLISANPVLDFRVGYVSDLWTPLWGKYFRDWRELQFNQRIEPPSWVLGDEAIAAGVKVVLFPSQVRQGGNNLVRYIDVLGPATRSMSTIPKGRSPEISSPEPGMN